MPSQLSTAPAQSCLRVPSRTQQQGAWPRPPAPGAVLWLPTFVRGRGPQGLPTLRMENQGGGICWLWWLCSQPRAGSAAMSPEPEPRQEEGGKGLEEEGCLIHLQVKGKGWGNGARGDHEHTRGLDGLLRAPPASPAPHMLVLGGWRGEKQGAGQGLTGTILQPSRCRSAHSEPSRAFPSPQEAECLKSMHRRQGGAAPLCPGGGRGPAKHQRPSSGDPDSAAHHPRGSGPGPHPFSPHCHAPSRGSRS